MGEFLIAPVVIIAIALAIWLFFTVGKTAKARRDEESLPDEPYARREEEIRRLEQDHAEAQAENVRHPARRP